MGLPTCLEVGDRGRKCRDLWCPVAGCCGPTSTPAPLQLSFTMVLTSSRQKVRASWTLGAIKHSSDRRTCLRTQMRPTPHSPTPPPRRFGGSSVGWGDGGRGRLSPAERRTSVELFEILLCTQLPLPPLPSTPHPPGKILDHKRIFFTPLLKRNLEIAGTCHTKEVMEESKVP